MIVATCHIDGRLAGITFDPHKTDSVLVVNPDAVLPAVVILKDLEAVARQ
jgi:hypothetical protein